MGEAAKQLISSVCSCRRNSTLTWSTLHVTSFKGNERTFLTEKTNSIQDGQVTQVVDRVVAASNAMQGTPTIMQHNESPSDPTPILQDRENHHWWDCISVLLLFRHVKFQPTSPSTTCRNNCVRIFCFPRCRLQAGSKIHQGKMQAVLCS